MLLLMTVHVVWLAAWSKGYNVVGEGRMRGRGDCEFSNAAMLFVEGRRRIMVEEGGDCFGCNVPVHVVRSFGSSSGQESKDVVTSVVAGLSRCCLATCFIIL